MPTKGIGACTRVDTTGKSVVDYVITTPQVLPLIKSKLPESDHLPMEFSLRYPTTSDIHNQPRTVTSDWSPIYKYVWSRDTTGLLNGVLKDELSKFYQSKFIEAVTEQHSLQEIAQNFAECFSQACQRTFGMKRVNIRRRPGPLWFDAECKQGRITAIQASERIQSLKKRKQRTFRESCVNKII